MVFSALSSERGVLHKNNRGHTGGYLSGSVPSALCGSFPVSFPGQFSFSRAVADKTIFNRLLAECLMIQPGSLNLIHIRQHIYIFSHKHSHKYIMSRVDRTASPRMCDNGHTAVWWLQTCVLPRALRACPSTRSGYGADLLHWYFRPRPLPIHTSLIAISAVEKLYWVMINFK